MGREEAQYSRRPSACSTSLNPDFLSFSYQTFLSVFRSLGGLGCVDMSYYRRRRLCSSFCLLLGCGESFSRCGLLGHLLTVLDIFELGTADLLSGSGCDRSNQEAIGNLCSLGA